MPTAEAVDHKVVSHKVVPHQAWVKARKELLAREKVDWVKRHDQYEDKPAVSSCCHHDEAHA